MRLSGWARGLRTHGRSPHGRATGRLRATRWGGVPKVSGGPSLGNFGRRDRDAIPRGPLEILQRGEIDRAEFEE